jgi:hypothetical protein
MRLTSNSHQSLQNFFRLHFGQRDLVLPLIEWDVSVKARLVVRSSGVTAMTLGTRVLLEPKALHIDSDGRYRILSRLAAHEATHVLQYQRMGWGRFLWRYLSDYAGHMQQAAKWDAVAHFRSYEAIRAEREAQAIEEAYASCCGRDYEELQPGEQT